MLGLLTDGEGRVCAWVHYPEDNGKYEHVIPPTWHAHAGLARLQTTRQTHATGLMTLKSMTVSPALAVFLAAMTATSD